VIRQTIQDKIQGKIQGAYQKHSRWIPLASFAGGFVFDMLTISRIDAIVTILQQTIYIAAVGALVALELLEGTREIKPPRWLGRAWEYREAALHFLLGALLNGYAIFYFKSASALTSFVFVGLLLGVLVANEFLRFGQSRIQVHTALLSLCLISFMACLWPILLGFIGVIPFLAAVVSSGLAFHAFSRWLEPRLSSRPGLLRKQVTRPFIAVHAIFAALYFAHAIPPVPLSVRYMGIYHSIEKKDGAYHLGYTRPAWKFWQSGDQTFLARPGDVVHSFVQVFSPTRFKDELYVRWLQWSERGGWQPSDAIPMQVTGGRDEGYRGVTKKTNYSPGLWRVQVETRDGQEIGRISFRIEPDTDTDERAVRLDVR
jgi:hypothetical protein